MTDLGWVVLGGGVLAYAAAVIGLVVTGRPADARALASFVPDCVVLLRRLLGDARLARRHKVALGAALGYLVMPIDLVPEFLPVIGYLDDALVVALALRWVLAAAGPMIVTEHWPGPERSLGVLLRLARRGPSSGVRSPARIAAFGLVGLSLCVWYDIADNCSGGLTCQENDPLLLSAGRGMALALCLGGALGVAARQLRRRRA
jgi:uncharacterized membrane protein YkvA (DUF1232 family)